MSITITDAERTLAADLFRRLADGSRGALGITRDTYGAGEQMAHDLMIKTGRAMGLEQRIDCAGNLYLTLPGRNRNLPAIMMGSHLDSVPEGGNFDGAAGVVAGMCVLASWLREGRQPQQDLTVMAIRAEEVAWFPAPYIGSRAAFGRLDADTIYKCLRVDTKSSLGAHMMEAGFDPAPIRQGVPQIDPAGIKCWLEVHIEQGPALVVAGKPAAIVTGIRGNLRYADCVITGRYGHAGADPREVRQDAVFAVGAFLQAMEALWLETEAAGRDLVCTVGKLHTDPLVDTITKIPGEVRFTMDIRSADNSLLLELDAKLREAAADISIERRVSIELGPYTNALPALMDPGLVAMLQAGAERLGFDLPQMPSGAGHDAAIFSNEGVPTVMIFVRNDGGSHNPDERMELDDFAVAVALLADAVEDLDSH
jgi:N-carbamoyl-L-amino-acid hydrolase